MASSAREKRLVPGEDDSLEWLAKTTRFLINMVAESKKTSCNEDIVTPCAKPVPDTDVSIAPCKPCGPNVGYPVVYSTSAQRSSKKSGRRGLVIVPCPPCGPYKDCAIFVKDHEKRETCNAPCAVKSESGKKSRKGSSRTKSPLSYHSSGVSFTGKSTDRKDSQWTQSGDETLPMGRSGLSSGLKYSDNKSSTHRGERSAVSSASIPWTQPSSLSPTSADSSRQHIPTNNVRRYEGTLSGKHYIARKSGHAPDSGYTSSVTQIHGPKKFSARVTLPSSRHSSKTGNRREQGATCPGEKFKTCFPQYDACLCNAPLPPWMDPNYEEPKPAPVYVPPEPSEPEFNPWHETDAKEPYRGLPEWEDGFPGGLPYDHLHMEFPTDESQDI